MTEIKWNGGAGKANTFDASPIIKKNMFKEIEFTEEEREEFINLYRKKLAADTAYAEAQTDGYKHWETDRNKQIALETELLRIKVSNEKLITEINKKISNGEIRIYFK